MSREDDSVFANDSIFQQNRKRRFTDQSNFHQEIKRSNSILEDQDSYIDQMDKLGVMEGNPNGYRTQPTTSSEPLSAVDAKNNRSANGTYKNGGTKKLTIRKYQQRRDPTISNFDLNWSLLEDSVVKIQQSEKASITCTELYNMVENLCQMNYAQEIYARLQTLIGRFAEVECTHLVAKCQDAPTETFLDILNRFWETFCQQLSLIRSVFLFLDRTYRGQTAVQSISIWDAGLDAFRQHIMERSGICSRTVTGILHLIEQERHGIQINRQLLKSLLRMFINLKIYEPKFEKEFLKTTEHFYREESQIKIHELNISDYLYFIQKRLKEEDERIHLYLEHSTHKKLIGIVQRCFITDYMDTIISTGPNQLLAEHRIPELALMFQLLSQVKDGLLTLKNSFAEYIKKMGRAMVMDTERDKTLIQDLMKFKLGLDQVIVQCFENNEKFQNALKDAFDFFVNTRPNKIAELIAKFMDSKLRTGNKECTEEELDTLMDRVIVLFRFVQGKDVFEAFYKRDLAKRLLLGRSASVDAERTVLSKLRTECGAALTQKLEGMFKDMELSKDFCATFKQYLEASDRKGRYAKLEVNISILTMGNWPTYQMMEVNIPPQLAELQQICAKFYISKHNGRKLQWQYTLASGVLKATFKPQVIKEVEVSLFQAMVLLMFNDRNHWSYEEIAENTKIEPQELKRTLQSLACGKFRVLQKQPRGRDVNFGDEFVFNEEFNDHLYRIRISQVQMRETEQEHQQTEEQIYQDRQYQVDAAVVRIMKIRKRLNHNQLITEILSQLRFPVKAADLKKRIESLIERDYMNRDKNDANVYNYVA